MALLVDLGRARRRLITWLLIGLAALLVMYIALFPSIEEQLQVFSEQMPEAFRALIGDLDLSTPEGYLSSEVFALTGPLLISALAITVGAGLAKSEREQTLSPVFTTPISRRTLAATNAAATVLTAAIGSAVVLVVLLVTTPMVDAQVGADMMAAAVLHLLMVSSALGLVAFGTAGATGNPGAALGAAWGLLVVAFVANSVAELLDGAEWLAEVSPWGWYGAGSAMVEGVDPVGLGLLALLGAVAAVVGVTSFERRDLQL